MIYPKFVKCNGSALRLVNKDGTLLYYRDGGNYYIGILEVNGMLSSVSTVADMNAMPLIPITYEEWKHDNGRYAPKLDENLNPINFSEQFVMRTIEQMISENDTDDFIDGEELLKRLYLK